MDFHLGFIQGVSDTNDQYFVSAVVKKAIYGIAFGDLVTGETGRLFQEFQFHTLSFEDDGGLVGILSDEGGKYFTFRASLEQRNIDLLSEVDLAGVSRSQGVYIFDQSSESIFLRTSNGYASVNLNEGSLQITKADWFTFFSSYDGQLYFGNVPTTYGVPQGLFTSPHDTGKVYLPGRLYGDEDDGEYAEGQYILEFTPNIGESGFSLTGSFLVDQGIYSINYSEGSELFYTHYFPEIGVVEVIAYNFDGKGFTLGNEEANSFTGFDFNEDAYMGLGGNDTLIGNAGNDNLDGGVDDDFLSGGTGSDSLFGGDGQDDLLGGSGDDFLFSGDGDDTVAAGKGNDVIVGGSGEGDDLYLGGKGFDVLVYTSATAGIKADLRGGDARSLLENLDAGIGVDVLKKVEGVEAGYFDDVVLGSGARNEIFLLSGNDVAKGRSGDDSLFGGKGSDRILGNLGDDLIDGGSGKDRLLGGEGSDTIDGGRQTDIMTGGADADTFMVDIGYRGRDRITDFESVDTLVFYGKSLELDVDLNSFMDEFAAETSEGVKFTFEKGKQLLLEGVLTVEELIDHISFDYM